MADTMNTIPLEIDLDDEDYVARILLHSPGGDEDGLKWPSIYVFQFTDESSEHIKFFVIEKEDYDGSITQQLGPLQTLEDVAQIICTQLQVPDPDDPFVTNFDFDKIGLEEIIKNIYPTYGQDLSDES